MHILGLYSSGDGREKIREKLLTWIAIEGKQKKARIKCSISPQLEQLDKLYMLFSFSPMWAIRARVQEELHEFWQLGELTKGFRRENKP